jgi:hypothetical protein
MKMPIKVKPFIVAALVTATVGGVTLAGVSVAHADTANTARNSLVDKIAAKFNLNRDEVQQVFDENKEEHHQQMRENVSERLQAKVDDGTITAEQKTALEAKLVELDTKRQALKDQNLTREQKREQMKTLRDEFEAWAKEQGISLRDVMPMMGHGGRGGHHGRGMMAPDDEPRTMDDSDSSSQSSESDLQTN